MVRKVKKLIYKSKAPKRWIWRQIYEFACVALPAEEMIINNMGYALITDDGLTTQIKFDTKEDEHAFLDNPYQYQLYHYLVTWLADEHILRGLTVVDVSCGKGGSSHFV